jgi:hypothetical protein
MYLSPCSCVALECTYACGRVLVGVLVRVGGFPVQYWGTQVQVYPLYANHTIDPDSNPSKHGGDWVPWL